MRAFLYGWFGFKNIGDDLLLERMLFILDGIASIEEVRVDLEEPGYLRDMLGQHPKVRAVRRVPGLYRRMIAMAGDYDLLIVGPGGLFPHRSLKRDVWQLANVIAWRLRGKKVAYAFFGANSDIEPLNAFVWKAIALFSNCFVPRDDSLMLRAGIKESSRVVASEDLILTTTRSFFSDDAAGCCVAVSFANLFQEFESGYEVFLSSCVEIVSGLLDRGFAVTLYSFTAGADERLNEGIVGSFPGRAEITYLNYTESLAQIDRISRHGLSIGMRFHSVVLSLCAEVPVVPISYSHKTTNLMRDCGMEAHVVDYCKSSAEYFERVVPLDAKKVLAHVDSLKENPRSYLVSGHTIDLLRDRVDGGISAFRACVFE